MKPAGSVHFELQSSCILSAFPKADTNITCSLLQVSTHGYPENQMLVWKYPSLAQVASLTGHLRRLLYLVMSPDGEALVTGTGDETLHLWNVFSEAHSQKVSAQIIQ
jgi:WD40 repeat protein